MNEHSDLSETEIQSVLDNADVSDDQVMDGLTKPNIDEVYPLTVIHSRYQGLYEGDVYVAFNLHFYNINPDAMGDDVACAAYYSETSDPIGRGSTPNEAILDLINRLNA